MRKRKLFFGIITILFCAVAVAVHPTAAQAANKNAYRTIFDASYYYQNYPDLAAAFGMNESALYSHFVNYGIKEGRSGSAEFDVDAYRTRYPDLEEAFGDNLTSYYNHYVSCGRAEGRIATTDGQAYKNTSTADRLNSVQSAKGTAAAPSKDAAQITGGIYTSYYNPSEARAVNIELAAQRINGTVIQPGAGFSFSNTVLPRTSANGYVEAPVIISGKMSTGMGGGICQVSSTLYAAMVKAGLPATERHAHSLEMSYVPKGMDATISGTSKDLKFVNIYTKPLVIYASAQNGTLVVSLGLQEAA